MNLFDITPIGAYMNAIKAAAESDMRARRHNRQAEQKTSHKANIVNAILDAFRRRLLSALMMTKAKQGRAA